METLLSCQRPLFLWISSYRTYEEWKHLDYDTQMKQKIGSYRTYEEWKLTFLM